MPRGGLEPRESWGSPAREMIPVLPGIVYDLSAANVEQD